MFQRPSVITIFTIVTLITTALLTITETHTQSSLVLLGNQTIESNIDNNSAGRAEAFSYTATASGTASKLYVYVDGNNATTKLTLGLYTNSARNNPSTLLAQATLSNPVKGAWNSTAFPAATVKAGQKYWIAILSPYGTGRAWFRDRTSGGISQGSRWTNLTSLPAIWSPGTNSATPSLSAYIVSEAQSVVPSIITQPSNQSVTVGSTATFNVTASGTAPLSYQWQRSSGSWADITGAASATYTTPSATLSDNGAQFRCIVSNPAGTVTSNAATLTVNAVTPSMGVNDFPNYRVFQRDIGGTSKGVAISGTYTNMNWYGIDARVLQHKSTSEIVGWTTINSNPASGTGTFSGILPVPQGGWYNIEIRARDSAGNIIGISRGTNKWGVGMIILCIGQSNMSGHGKPPFTVATSDLAVNYSNAGRWEHLADPYDDDSLSRAVDNDNSTAAGSMVPAIANSLFETFNFPIAFVPSPKDNSNLYSQWAYRNPSNHYDTTTLYGQSITKARSVGGVELIVMHQGEADTNAHRTESQYEADFATLRSHYEEDLYALIPIFLCQLGPIALGFNTRTDADVVAARSAQHNLDNGTDIFMAATAMDQPRLDHVHFTTQGLAAIGRRVAQAIKHYFGTESYYRGPAITAASLAEGGNSVEVQIDHRGGNNITPASGIKGFSLFSNGSPVSIASASRIDANRIRLTPTSAIPQGATTKLRYLWGSDPDTSGLVKDNSPLALPLENTTLDITVIDPLS